jgi:hypothetical protein
MTTTVTIRFKRLLQDRQELGVEGEYMVSTVYFDVIVGNRTWPNQQVNLKMSAGADFESDKGSIEVEGEPHYEGPHNYQGFRDCAEEYYRSLIGSRGTVIHVAPGAVKNFAMGNNDIAAPKDCSYEAG